MRLALIGSGVLCKTLLRHFASDEHKFVGFFDDVCGMPFKYELRNFGKVCDAPQIFLDGHYDALVMAIGYRHLANREMLFEWLSCKHSIPFKTLVHASSVVLDDVILSPGVIVMANCVLDVGTRVKENTVLNISCNVSHDCEIGPHCFIGPNVSFAGFTKVGRRCFIGIGVTVINNLSLGSDCIVGAASTVTKSAGDNSHLLGSPARPANFNLKDRLR